MEAKNFRIGNLLGSKEWGGIGQIEGIELMNDCWELKIRGYVHKWEKGKYFDLEPIKLTESWLKELGFYFTPLTNGRKRATNWKVDLFQDEKGIYSFDLGRIYIDVKYVHELQNLFFALTGQELTLKAE